MAQVKTGMNCDAQTVVLIAQHATCNITEHLTASEARRLSIELLSAAGRVERADARPEWP
ncbi:hypothetical protein EDF38_0144 [Frigoribacterium sp. PhB160]|uniref:hypothetical protein n=1 Tax=Frigoribacterium sp. PhB160 TaxID=2485192 RepID=UPI000F47510D|nr:hypothetical protein [Frigoribacterium sp. PhB160]ROS61065.1 hypothetical protein EDF38_0144 [Frigoribacterium sp. PhB160]